MFNGQSWVGLPIAVGRALSNENRTVHCLISDGECAEGSIWEALRYITEKNIKNIRVYVNINGYAAYDSVDTKYLSDRLKAFCPDVNLEFTTVNHFPFLKGLNAHYHVMSEEDYKLARKILDYEETF